MLTQKEEREKDGVGRGAGEKAWAQMGLVAGGSVGIMCGAIVMCFAIGGISISIWWAFPLIAVSFISMLIVPGHILNHKARKQCLKN